MQTIKYILFLFFNFFQTELQIIQEIKKNPEIKKLIEKLLKKHKQVPKTSKLYKMLPKDILIDTNDLKNCSIADFTGKDGVSKEELINKNKPGQYDQRARSAASLWLKNHGYPEQNVSTASKVDEPMDDQITFKITAIAENNQERYLKICLPKNNNLLSLIINNSETCKSNLIDYLESQDNVLQPFTVDESVNPTKTIDFWIKEVDNIIKRLKGDTNASSSKKEDKLSKFVIIKLPGSTKKIKVDAVKFFDQADEDTLQILRTSKILDLSSFRVDKSDQKAKDSKFKLDQVKLQQQFYKKVLWDIMSSIRTQMDQNKARFKESPQIRIMNELSDMVNSIKNKIKLLIDNSRQLVSLRNDTRFANDFKMIRKKQESIKEIRKLEDSMEALKTDLTDSATKSIYENLEEQVRELNAKLLNETGFEEWEETNGVKVENLLKQATKVKYELDKIDQSLQKRYKDLSRTKDLLEGQKGSKIENDANKKQEVDEIVDEVMKVDRSLDKNESKNDSENDNMRMVNNDSKLKKIDTDKQSNLDKINKNNMDEKDEKKDIVDNMRIVDENKDKIKDNNKEKTDDNNLLYDASNEKDEKYNFDITIG